MEYTCFEVSFEEKIAHIRFNRPEKRNSMNAEFWQELPHAIRDIDATGGSTGHRDFINWPAFYRGSRSQCICKQRSLFKR